MLAEAACPAPDIAYLYSDQQHAHDQEDYRVTFTQQTQAAECEQAQQALEAEEDELLGEHQRQQQLQLRAADEAQHDPGAGHSRLLAALFRGQRLFEDKERQQDRKEGIGRCREGRDCQIVRGFQGHDGDDRAEDETESEGCPGQAQALRALLRRGDVAEGRLCGGDVRAEESVDDP